MGDETTTARSSTLLLASVADPQLVDEIIDRIPSVILHIAYDYAVGVSIFVGTAFRIDTEYDMFMQQRNAGVGAVHCARNGTIYLCEAENGRVQMFQHDGTFLSTFGSKGAGTG